MTDIHAHVLPAADDGARTMEEALEMLSRSEKTNVKTIVATPHYNPEYGWDRLFGKDPEEVLGPLRVAARAAGLGIEIFYGMELRVTEELVHLLEKRHVWSLNGSKYALIEFAQWETRKWCDLRLRELLAAGFVPVIAHPERLDFVHETPWLVYDWLELGCHVQLTKGSILGRFGYRAKVTADYLLENDWVACVASDTHRSEWRTPDMDEIRVYLSERYSENYAEALLSKNPRRICENRRL